jgi:hypothetical protein
MIVRFLGIRGVSRTDTRSMLASRLEMWAIDLSHLPWPKNWVQQASRRRTFGHGSVLRSRRLKALVGAITGIGYQNSRFYVPVPDRHYRHFNPVHVLGPATAFKFVVGHLYCPARKLPLWSSPTPCAHARIVRGCPDVYVCHLLDVAFYTVLTMPFWWW